MLSKKEKLKSSDLFNFYKGNAECQERNAPPNKKRSKTTDTTPLPAKTIHPPASPHKGKSTKHRSRNTHTTHICHPTLDPTQTETQINSRAPTNSTTATTPPMKQKPSQTHSDTTIHGSNGQANRRRNRSPSIPLHCISTNA